MMNVAVNGRRAASQDGPLVELQEGDPPVRRIPNALARRFAQVCTSATAEAISGTDLTPMEFSVMAYVNPLVGEPDIDQGNLAARLGIDRNNTSLLVASLERQGLLERRVSPRDRRRKLVRLTPEGERLFEQLHPASVAGQWALLEVLDPDERELLLDLLLRVIEGNRELARPGTGRRPRNSWSSSAKRTTKERAS